MRSYGDESRELILAAAQKLFAARGLDATSMQEIAEAARLSRATVFNQFGSKHLVLDAITAKSLRAYRDMLAAALVDESTPTAEILQDLFVKMSVGLERNRSLYREVFTEIRKISMGLDAEGESPGLKREAFELLVRIFARGQARRELSRDHPAEVLATAYDSLLSGAVAQWLHAAPKSPLGPLLTSLAAVFLKGAAAKP
ncbi:MAG: TetR/AcrR family transcriptional regulator [Hyphomonadaceae bacterium]|nr:TetR/AcrR family transcriptional regulator [Hyphomonadaceae bacterium]